MTAKEQIIDLFRKNVKGKSPNVENRNPRHDGKKRALVRRTIWNFC